jgi:two-component system chemotaxis response regulator CheB
MHPKVVVMVASAGGIQALLKVLSNLPATFTAPIVVVQHRTPEPKSLLTRVLSRCTPLRVVDAKDEDVLQPGTVYVARPDRHLTITQEQQVRYSNGHRIRHVLSSANPLFKSAAETFGPGTIGVVLTGTDGDGTDGVQAIKNSGGIVIAQDERTSEHFGMPQSAITSGAVDYVLPVDEIAPILQRLTS